MNRVCKRSLLSLLLALALAIGMLPVAVFAADTYTVRFETDSPSVIRPVLVEHGNKLTQPATPRKSGYVFRGWYKDSACTDRWSFDRDTVTRNMVLYASWEDRENTSNSGYYYDGYYYGNPYYSSDYYNDYYYDYYGYYGYRYYDEEYGRFLYTNDWWYYDRDDDGYYTRNYNGGANNTRERIEVVGGADQVYTGDDEITFTVYDVSTAGIMSMVVYPDSDRSKEKILRKGTDFTVTSSPRTYGVKVTIKHSILDGLANGRYDVRMYFVNEMASAYFYVNY